MDSPPQWSFGIHCNDPDSQAKFPCCGGKLKVIGNSLRKYIEDSVRAFHCEFVVYVVARVQKFIMSSLICLFLIDVMSPVALKKLFPILTKMMSLRTIRLYTVGTIGSLRISITG